eukprot:1891829-Karenia_brevis.AAC.1
MAKRLPPRSTRGKGFDDHRAAKMRSRQQPIFSVISWNVCGISQPQLETAIEKLELDGVNFDAFCLQEYGRRKTLRDVALPNGRQLIMGKRVGNRRRMATVLHRKHATCIRFISRLDYVLIVGVDSAIFLNFHVPSKLNEEAMRS